MENASKALLIAASVLIAILLIVMAVSTMNSTSGTVDEVQGTMQTTEMATFNSKFTSYVGTNKSKAQVVSLLNTVIASNATNSAHQISISPGAGVATDTSSPANILNTLSKTTYTIKIDGTTGYDKGYVKVITIE